MATKIYYFTGTGNSLTVARAIAEKMDGELIAIASLIHNESITLDADVVGLVFPVYHKGLPLILKRFIERTETLANKYIFSVSTYGDTIGVATKHLAKLIQSRDGKLAAGFGVHLPYNYITPAPVLKDFYSSFSLRQIPIEKQQALIAAAPQKIERIVAAVNTRATDTFEITPDLLTRLADTLNLNETLGKSSWLKIGGVTEPTDLSFIESRQLMDRRFHADETCIGCGTCARVCPVGNISMSDALGETTPRPVWHHRCEQCFACLHWCPQEAIQFGDKTTGQQRYHHPDVKLADMLRQPGSNTS